MAEFVKLDEATLQAARVRGRVEYGSRRALSCRFDPHRQLIVIALDSGKLLSFDPRRLEGLEDATSDDLADVIVEGAGYTLSFPRLDEDFGLRALIERFGAVAAESTGT